MVLLFFALPAGAGALAPFLPSRWRQYLGWGSAALMAALFGLALSQLSGIAEGDVASFSYAWVDSLGVRFSFLLDGYSILFVLLITGMASLILFYSQSYMRGHANSLKFYAWMLVFSGAMLGLVTASNLIVLYLFWEMTTVSSFFLIGLTDGEEESRFNAVQALLVTTLGSLAMLAGFVLIYQALGTLELPEIWSRAAELQASSLMVPAAALIIIGVVAKSALFPFHIWLPSAMVAPTPVSAYLHSATMVTAGVCLVARLTPAFAGVNSWEIPLVSLGMGTLVIGGLLALRQTDLKALLAYSTVSQLGMIVALYALGTQAAVLAATLHLVSHATFKGGMFLVAGAIEHESGTRDLRRLGGLAGAMPALAVVATVVALSSGGIPPLNGFVSKEALLDATLHTSGVREWLLPLVLAVGSAVTLAYSLRFLVGAFFGRPRDPAIKPHRAPLGLLLSPGVLAVAVVALGVYPAMLAGDLMAPAVRAVTQHEAEVELALWHGFNLPLAISVAVIAGGVALYPGMRHLNNALAPLMARGIVVAAYRRGIDLTYGPLPALYRRIQHGDLRGYVAAIALVAMALVAAGLARAQAPPFSDLVDGADLGVLDYALALLLGLGAVSLLFRKGRLEAVFNLGLVGMLVAAVFALYSAPDLALTQIVVELLMVVLFMLGLRRMLAIFNVRPRLPTLAPQLLVSLAFGSMVTLLLLWVLVTPQHPSISPFFIENTESVAHAKNVVNTILIDFRGYDTLGEITVIALAAVGVFAMMRALKERP